MFVFALFHLIYSEVVRAATELLSCHQTDLNYLCVEETINVFQVVQRNHQTEIMMTARLCVYHQKQ